MNINMAYQFCQSQQINYCELADTNPPQAKRTERQQDDKLYAIEVLEEKDEQVKIHYTGYSSDYDEWRNKEDIVLPTELERYRTTSNWLTLLSCSFRVKIKIQQFDCRCHSDLRWFDVCRKVAESCERGRALWN